MAVLIALGAVLIGLWPSLSNKLDGAPTRTSGEFARSTVGTSPTGCHVQYELQRTGEASTTDADWHQSGQTVVLRGPMLASGAAVTTDFRGEYDGANAFPVQFRLNDTAGQPTLVASQAPATGNGGQDDHRGKGKKNDGDEG